MNKTKLQELCHRKRFPPPEYSTTKEGPSHKPSFTATVTVAGLTYSTENPAHSSKEAQNNAAGVAIRHFTDLKPSSLAGTSQPGKPETSQSHLVDDALLVSRDGKSLEDMQHLYKSQLQNYAQKRNLSLPTYSFESTGPSHYCRFKSKVTIDGQIYESPHFFPTLKEAEHAAAKVALMSLCPAGVEEDDCGLYKNLLQELSRQEGYLLPVYRTEKSGLPHLPTFLSTVEIEGEAFVGQKARTKKQAEMNAAKVAYVRLKERRSNLSPSCQELKSAEFSSSSLHSGGTADLQQMINPKSMILDQNTIPAEQAEYRAGQGASQKGGSDGKSKSPSPHHSDAVKVAEFSHSSFQPSGAADLQENVKVKAKAMSISNQSMISAEQAGNRDVHMDPAAGSSVKSELLQPARLPESLLDLMPAEANGDPSCLKVIVFPRKAKVSDHLPPGTVLKEVDDEWMAAEFR